MINNKRCLIIAEAGVNHNGSLETAFRLCDAVKEANADVIKFQTWVTERIITRKIPQADYQKANTGREQSQYDMLKSLELSYEDFAKIKEYCDSIGLLFASTADDSIDLDFLASIGIPFAKVGSGDINNIPLLRYIGQKNIPVILSTGMSTLWDVDNSIRALREGGAADIRLLHCTTNYPCPFDTVNLRAMETLRTSFNLPVGYSDHTLGIEVPVAAVAMGAEIIEKHFTLDRNMPGPDHRASTEPAEFKRMVEAIRHVELALGSGLKEPSEEEVKISEVVLKKIVAARPIPAGKRISPEDVCTKRHSTGLSAKYWDAVIGSLAHRAYEQDEAIELSPAAGSSPSEN